MFNFIKIQYQLGKITSAQVWSFYPTWLTTQQVNEIINSSPSNNNI